MRKGINRVVLMGNLGDKPALRYTATNNTPVTNLLVAVNEPNGDTTWHDIVVWGAEAERCVEHCEKGDKVYIEGRLETESIPQPDGKVLSRPKIHARNVEFMFELAG